MVSNNPFEDNPWAASSRGPKFGNAYEDDSNMRSYGVEKMPSPSDYKTTTGWSESNKTEYPPNGHDEPQNAWSQPDRVDSASPQQDAYQFSGTRLNENQDSFGGNAYSKVQVEESAPTPAGGKPRPTQAEVEDALPPKWDDRRLYPSKLRLLLRTLMLISSIGHLGFAAGASPYSGEDVPFDSAACFYYLYAVAILTIIWSFFHVFLYCYRRLLHGNKMNRVVMTGVDLLLAILWGVGIIVEIAMYRCSPGDYNHWCDFYNVSIFWGMLAFVLFIVATVWDLVGACIARRK